MIKQFLLRSLAYTAAMFVVYWVLNTFLTGNVWEGIPLSKSALTAEYCEFNDPQRFFHQSMNTYSNLVYFFWAFLFAKLRHTMLKIKDLRRKIGWLNFHYCPI